MFSLFFVEVRKQGDVFIVLFLSLILTSCKGSSEKLTIRLIPVRDAGEMAADFEPIRVQIEEKLGIPIEVTVTENSVSLLEGMKTETIDIGMKCTKQSRSQTTSII